LWQGDVPVTAIFIVLVLRAKLVVDARNVPKQVPNSLDEVRPYEVFIFSKESFDI
jgi:hypothetical protein